MKYLKILGLAAAAAMVLTAFTAGTVSATTLEINGAAQNKSVAITLSLTSGSSMLLQLTGGGFFQTCTESSIKGSTTVFTGATVSAPIAALSFSKCVTEPYVVDKTGTLHISHIAGTTDGTVRSEGAEVTVPSAIGKLNCKTGAGVDIGRLTGKSGVAHATLDINAVTNCGFLAPSAAWTGTYAVINPTGLGVVA